MKHTQIFYVTFLALLISSLISCKKEKEEEEESINKLLTNRSEKTWILRSVLQKDKEVLNDEWREVLEEPTIRYQKGWTEKLKTCQTDNEWSFNDNGNVLKTPGYVRCTITEKDSTFNYFLGGPQNQSIYFKELVSEYVWYPDLHRDSLFTFYRIQKTDILVLTENELKYKSIHYAPLGNSVTTRVFSFIKK